MKPIWMLRTTESHMPAAPHGLRPVVQGELVVEVVVEARLAGWLNDSTHDHGDRQRTGSRAPAAPTQQHPVVGDPARRALRASDTSSVPARRT